LRKYLTWKDVLLMLPSLLMTEILTWGYSILNGTEGVKYKVRGLKDGITIEVSKIKCDRTSVLKKLDWKIPEEQLSYNVVGRMIKKIANIVYRINYGVITK